VSFIVHSKLAGGNSMSDLDYSDYPKYTPGRIRYGTLFRILRWEEENGIAQVSEDEIRAYMEDGMSAAQAGLSLGLIDYGQASGETD
jgi:hypothetical protein